MGHMAAAHSEYAPSPCVISSKQHRISDPTLQRDELLMWFLPGLCYFSIHSEAEYDTLIAPQCGQGQGKARSHSRDHSAKEASSFLSEGHSCELDLSPVRSRMQTISGSFGRDGAKLQESQNCFETCMELELGLLEWSGSTPSQAPNAVSCNLICSCLYDGDPFTPEPGTAVCSLICPPHFPIPFLFNHFQWPLENQCSLRCMLLTAYIVF